MQIVSAYDLSLRPSFPQCDVFFSLDGEKDIDIVDVFRMAGYYKCYGKNKLRILTSEGWKKWEDVVSQCSKAVRGFNNYTVEKTYYTGGNLISNKYEFTKSQMTCLSLNAAGKWAIVDHISKKILNATIPYKIEFLKQYDKFVSPQVYTPKRIIGGLRYLRMCILGANDYGEEGRKKVECIYDLYDDLISNK